jgi:hypothetical protein
MVLPSEAGGQLRVLYRAPERNTPALRFRARLWPENPLR